MKLEGSAVLEQLASLDLVDDFLAAVDADDIPLAVRLMRRAEVDEETIAIVVEKIESGED